MSRGFLIGRLFGTDIFCSPGFFILVAVYMFIAGPGAGALFSVAVVISILVHEFGHVFAVKWFLRERSTVVLWGLGGLCIHPPTESAGKQIGISLMGPAFGFALGALSVIAVLFVPPGAEVVARFIGVMIWINLVWGVVNLLPVLPLDGGQALRAALRAALGRGRSARITRMISIVTAAVWTAGAVYLDRAMGGDGGFRFVAVLGGLLLFQNLTKPDVAYH